MIVEENDDEMRKHENKLNAIYLIKLAVNYIKIEKQDIKYNIEVNKKLKQAKDIIAKALNEKSQRIQKDINYL